MAEVVAEEWRVIVSTYDSETDTTYEMTVGPQIWNVTRTVNGKPQGAYIPRGFPEAHLERRALIAWTRFYLI
jgi:hypothetical protein